MCRRVTVVVLCVCLCVCVSVKSHLTSGASVCPENSVVFSAGNRGVCGVFSETASFKSCGNLVGAVFSAMKAEYVVVAEQAHPLGPAYSIPNYFYPAAYTCKLSTCFDHHSILYRI